MKFTLSQFLTKCTMKTLILIVFCAFASVLAESENFIEANTKFASTLYKEILKTENGNFLVSPLSAETILTLTHSGARGPSAEELRVAIHLPNDTKKIEEEVKALLPSLSDSDNLYTLKLANKMYVRKNFDLHDEFKKATTEVYSAQSESIDFVKNVEAAQTINHWVEEQTNNKIKNLVDSDILDNNTRIVLVNALYFKADWLQKFYLLYTQKIGFHKTVDDSVEVDAMHSKHGQYFLYYECERLNAKFLELPFKGQEASITFILPNEQQGLEELELKLDYALIPHNVTQERIQVALPKFKIKSTINIKKILINLGVKTIFTDFKSDLSGIAGEPGDLVLDQVLQKTFIDVNEEGVEAAAATFALVRIPLMGYNRKPKTFIADHPFIFYVKVKGVVVFVGRVTDPSL